MKQPIRDHLSVAAWAVLCALLLLAPGSAVAPPDRGPGWLERLEDPFHGLLALVLTLLALRSFRRFVARPGRWAAGGSLAYLVALEALQELVPGRGWQASDLAWTAAGVAAAAAVRRWRRVPRRSVGGAASL